jgi:hypothetical protein
MYVESYVLVVTELSWLMLDVYRMAAPFLILATRKIKT